MMGLIEKKMMIMVEIIMMIILMKKTVMIINGRGFINRVLEADSVITHQRCMKYFLHCER